MKRLAKVLMVLALGAVICLPGVAGATYTSYTSESAFLSAIGSGYYLNDFPGVVYGSYYPNTSQSFSGNGFSYDISATDGLYGVPSAISTWTDSTPLVVTKTGSKSIYAVGGEFFTNENFGADVLGNVTVTFSPGSLSQTLYYTTLGDRPFFGVTSDTPITSLSVIYDGVGVDSHFPTIDHLYVGSPVPIPPSALLLGSGLLGLVGLGWRRRKTNV